LGQHRTGGGASIGWKEGGGSKEQNRPVGSA
jgi:hypothetical protein